LASYGLLVSKNLVENLTINSITWLSVCDVKLYKQFGWYLAT
jgi:hypothetical protein